MEIAAPLYRRPTLYLVGWLMVGIAAALVIIVFAQPAHRVSLGEAAAGIMMALVSQGLLLTVSVGVLAAAVTYFRSRSVRLVALPFGLVLGVVVQAGFMSLFATETFSTVIAVMAAPFIEPFWVAVLMSVFGFWLPYLTAIGYVALSARKSVPIPIGIALVGLIAGALVETLLTGWPLAPW